MFGSDVLEVAIGLVLLFLILSLICSAIREGLEAWLKTRSIQVEKGIRELLNDPTGKGLTSQLYNHPLLDGLFNGEYDSDKADRRKRLWYPRGSNLPSYIPTANFAGALIDIVARGPVSTNFPDQKAGNKNFLSWITQWITKSDPPPNADQTQADQTQSANQGQQPGPAQQVSPSESLLSLAQLRSSVSQIKDNARVQRALLHAIDTAQGDFDRAQANIEAWFDSAMDRVSGWYKRRTQIILFFMGFTLAVALNVDSLTVAKQLSHDTNLRKALVAQAEVLSKSEVLDPTDANGTKRDERIRQLQSQMSQLGFPMGWNGFWPGPQEKSLECQEKSSLCLGYNAKDGSRGVWWLRTFPILLGWLITAFAITLGAPFWFDVLNKFMVIRSTVKPHEKSPEEASEDRQNKSQTPQPTPGASGQGAGAAAVGTGAGTATVLEEANFQPHEWTNRRDPQEGDL